MRRAALSSAPALRQAGGVRPHGLVISMLVLGACGAPGGSGETEGESDDAPMQEPPTPAFIEPASGAMKLPVTRVDDVRLRVAAISTGLTTLEIDEVSFGTLSDDGPVGLLEPELLTLHMGGGLVPGRHFMQLVTPGLEEPQTSSLLTVNIEPEIAPSLMATTPEPTGLMGAHIAVAGSDDHGLLLLVTDDAQAHVLPALGSGWDLDRVRTLAVPGLRLDPGDTEVPISGFRIVHDASPERLRLAWRVGLPGRRIDAMDVVLDDDAQGSPRTIVDLDPSLVGAVEHAALGRPLLLEDVALAELLALTDAEQPRPGDRAVVSVALRNGSLDPGRARRLAFGTAADLDLVGSAIDLTAPPGLGPQVVGARMGGILPVAIELDRRSGTARLRPSKAEPLDVAFQAVEGRLMTILGAFGSRTVAGYGQDPPRVVLAQIDDWGNNDPHVVFFDQTDLGAAAGLRGPFTGTLLGGAPVFLLPMGLEHPVHAIISTSAGPSVQPLESLRCDAVALPARREANTEPVARVACLRSGELHLATLRHAD